MNPFTTDHPLNAGSSWFDREEYPRLSFVLSTAVLALVLTPPLVLAFCYCALGDKGADPSLSLAPFAFWASGMAYLLGVFCAIPTIWFWRLLARRWRKRYGPKGLSQ
jgi:hypothetical protein